MIVRLTGTVTDVHETHAVLERDGIGYEVLICGYATGELAACRGQQVTLHTLQYLEGSGAGGNMVPRLVGFLHTQDRAFFERFITVKGMGVRKAIKALVESTGGVAAAIESGDTKALCRLPGISKRSADQIVAELKGKVALFAVGAAQAEGAAVPGEGWSAQQRDALEVMVALGERRADAQRWLERAIQLSPGDREPDEWITLAYRARSGRES